MYLELFLASTLVAVGSIIFGRFEEGAPRWRRLSKLFLFLAVTAIVSKVFGRTWALLWIFSAGLWGFSVHTRWCKRHGVGVLSAEPRKKYYQLRGWKWPG